MFKHSKKIFALFTIASIFLTILFFSRCSETPINPKEGSSHNLSKVASSAILHIFNTSLNNQTVNIHGVTSGWFENQVTFNTRPTSGPVEASFVTNVSGAWIDVNITGLVNKWLNGTYNINYGLMLESSGTQLETFSSREGANPPYIDITYSDGSTQTVSDTADAEVTELHPDGNFGSEVTMFAGTVNGLQKQDLIKFDVQLQIDCGECRGKVSQLTLQYNGASDATIKVKQKNGAIIFDAVVVAGGSFTINGTDNGTFGTEITLYVNGVENTKIHTSCSQPIGPGLVKGDFTVLEGYSKDGGLLCPMPDCGVCKDKVSQLTLQYNGASDATIKVKQKNGAIVFDALVTAGGSFIINGTDKGTFGTEITLYVNGVENTKIHTSCSQPIGPGLIKGDFEVIEGYSKSGGKLCPIPPTPPAGWCDGTKPKSLGVNYTGEDCSASANNQASDKWSCSGDPAFTSPVTIKATNKSNPTDPTAKVWFNGQVAIGDLFFINAANAGATKLEANTYVYVYDLAGNLLQTIKFHTSCSQPLAAGDQFGSILMVEFVPEN